MITKQYSKTKAVANHVVWTDKEVIPVPFTVPGPFPNKNFAKLRIFGRAMYCIGYRVDFAKAAQDRFSVCTVGLYNGAGALISGTQSTINGVTPYVEQLFVPPVAMPSGSIWQFISAVVQGANCNLPSGMTITYLLRYANGPITNVAATVDLTEAGIGFWQIGKDFVVS